MGEIASIEKQLTDIETTNRENPAAHAADGHTLEQFVKLDVRLIEDAQRVAALKP